MQDFTQSREERRKDANGRRRLLAPLRLPLRLCVKFPSRGVLFLFFVWLLLTCPALVLSQEGDIRQVHDPSIIKQGDTYYTLYSLASRSRPSAIEAPNIIRKNDYYYLFVSFDFYCRGKDSTYNIRVGRSRNLTGPYMDRSGKPMMQGGGTLVVAGTGRWAGPGHCAVLQEKDGDKLVYHAYDTESRGVPTLRIANIRWDSEGWPGISN